MKNKAWLVLRPFTVTSSIMIAATSLAIAGSGVVNNNGTINISINLRFPPTAGDLTNVQNQVTAASQVLWDASEGQLRFGTVTLSCGSVNEDLADMWVFPQAGRAGVSFACDGSNLQASGVHVNQFLPSSTGIVLGHEFGHLALGLGDEYSEQNRFGACWGFGPCIETAALSEQNQCLMQQPGGFSQTEFCTAAGHDLVVGEGTPCTAGAAPCTTNCQFFNPTTGLYETSQETAVCGGACWPHLVANFSFLVAPAALPVAAPPAGFVNPTFVNNCQATDTVLLVLDRSGSMAWNTENDFGEVCGNGVDDDGDGSVDETDDCTQPRLAFVQAAARAWLALANGQGVKAGVVSFNQLASLDAPFQDVNATNLPTLNTAVDNLVAGGNTAIGRALSSTTLLFGGQTGATTKTAFLISDGVNTEGETPQSVVPSLQAQGIRVFTISTGGASDDTTLSEISGTTLGSTIDSRDSSALVAAFAQQWARYRNTGILIPQLPYSLNQRSDIKESDQKKRDPLYWATENPPRLPTSRSPQTDSFYVHFEEGTQSGSVILAGNMGDMSGFGVEATLSGPAGPGPTTFDSATPQAGLRVVRDRFFVLIEVTKPNPGDWKVTVRGQAAKAPLQSGNITILSDNPRVDLFTSLNRHVVVDPSKPVKLRATPIYSTTLHRVDLLNATVKRPDGTLQPITLSSNFDTGGGEDYSGLISDMPFIGMYEVRVIMRTGPNTINDPGESIFSTAPANTVPVPVLERTSVEYFYVTKGKRVCRSGNPRDCDGDGILDESYTKDTDGDGTPDGYDRDSDNDEVPDAVEGRETPAHPSGVYCSPWLALIFLFLAIVLSVVAWLKRSKWAFVLEILLIVIVAVLIWFCCRR